MNLGTNSYQSKHYAPTPIDGPPAKPTTPQVHLINQLRASHSTLMVVLLPGWSLNEQVLTERYSENSMSPLKYHKFIIIIKMTSSYHKYSHHVH
jgi:hypothetical protein